MGVYPFICSVGILCSNFDETDFLFRVRVVSPRAQPERRLAKAAYLSHHAAIVVIIVIMMGIDRVV